MTNAGGPDIPEIGIDIADFSRLRNKGYVYVDKTEFVREILDGPRARLFLSRPRRFGKTLLIDTLEQAAAGRKELFSGLAIDRLREGAEWPRSHVLRISMNAFGDDPSSLDLNLAT
ncbi:MAG: AAA family ATPase, partial [Deltaproteobacteria bacterium]|nr:AAA family ATPase [Deltaproteobacteria bacterium]